MSPNSPQPFLAGHPGTGAGGPLKVALVTQGCKLNQADSRQLARRFQEAGYLVVDPRSPEGEALDVVVLNTCTVTAAADGKARQALRSAKRSSPGALVVATGCYAERDPAELESMSAVSLVVGNSRKDDLVTLVNAALAERGTADPESSNYSPPVPPDTASPLVMAPAAGRTRAMIKIQEGCDQVCAYCIVPRVRGRERSIPADELVAQVRESQDQGCREVVLTGTQLGSYGFDLPGHNLRSLLERVLAETAIPRIRVSSLQPQELTLELVELWQDSRLCPHFHIPLQHGSDSLLSAMRRRYDTSRFAESVQLVRRAVPGSAVSTDVIVGFPGESQELFQESLDFASSMAFSAMHVFPFSPRPGTSAFHFKEQVSSQPKKERMARMLEVAQSGAARFRQSNLGRVYPVLWESEVPTGATPDGLRMWQGLTPNYLKVHCSSPSDLRNVIAPAELTGERDGCLVARIVEDCRIEEE